MSKRWDHLRVVQPRPITDGRWMTSFGNAVSVAVTNDVADLAMGGGTFVGWRRFDAAALRELAEFCTELADQLEQS